MSEEEDDNDVTVVPATGGTHISGRVAYRDAAIELANAAARKLSILSYAFRAETYGDADFVAALRKLAIAHRHSEIRILIHSPQLSMKRGHRAVELGRSASSRIKFHKLAPQHGDVVEELVIADEVGYLHRDNPDNADAIYGQHDPAEARRHLRRFDALWEQSTPASEMRELGI